MQVFRALLAAILLTGNVSVQAQVRASRLARLVHPAPAAAVLPTSPVWQLVRVERVVDADTYEVATAGGRAKVRLLGADAPEADQPFGPEATTLVGALLRRQYVKASSPGISSSKISANQCSQPIRLSLGPQVQHGVAVGGLPGLHAHTEPGNEQAPRPAAAI